MNANMLRGAWISKGFTDLQLAKAIHVNPSTLSRWMNGSVESMSIGKLIEIINVLNLDSTEVMRIFFA